MAQEEMECTLTSFQKTVLLWRQDLVLKVGQTLLLILVLLLQFPPLILNPSEGLLHWSVALACQQLDETEVRKWTFRGQAAKQPEEPICQLKSSWEWKKLFHNVGNKTLHLAI